MRKTWQLCHPNGKIDPRPLSVNEKKKEKIKQTEFQLQAIIAIYELFIEQLIALYFIKSHEIN